MQEYQEIKSIINKSEKILIVQADNPDADSLASSLALEQILEEMGKKVFLYCGVDMPGYLKYLEGWDRVRSEMPSNFDASIIVDTSTITLLDIITASNKTGWLSSKPCIVLDHHVETDNLIPFANVLLNDPEKSSTGELIYSLAKETDWPLDKISGAFIMTSILGDTQGLSNEHATARTYRVMAELVELGVNRPELEELRRALNKMPEEIFRYKARLIERTEFHLDNKLAMIVIPHQEIIDYSPLYNPNPLIQIEHLQTESVKVSIALKHYADGKITASIRSAAESPIAGELAESFGGGGHRHSSGFKITSGKSLDEVKNQCIKISSELLEKQ